MTWAGTVTLKHMAITGGMMTRHANLSIHHSKPPSQVSHYLSFEAACAAADLIPVVRCNNRQC